VDDKVILVLTQELASLGAESLEAVGRGEAR
jgi:hypothetical protein